MHTLPSALWNKGKHTLRHMWEHTQVPFWQIEVLFCHSSPESHFPSIQSLWREGFLPAILSEVKVIRLGMRSGLLGLPLLLFSPSPSFTSPNYLFKSKNTPLTISLPQVTFVISFTLPSRFLSDPIFPLHQSIRNEYRDSACSQSITHFLFRSPEFGRCFLEMATFIAKCNSNASPTFW